MWSEPLEAQTQKSGRNLYVCVGLGVSTAYRLKCICYRRSWLKVYSLYFYEKSSREHAINFVKNGRIGRRCIHFYQKKRNSILLNFGNNPFIVTFGKPIIFNDFSWLSF